MAAALAVEEERQGIAAEMVARAAISRLRAAKKVAKKAKRASKKANNSASIASPASTPHPSTNVAPMLIPVVDDAPAPNLTEDDISRVEEGPEPEGRSELIVAPAEDTTAPNLIEDDLSRADKRPEPIVEPPSALNVVSEPEDLSVEKPDVTSSSKEENLEASPPQAVVSPPRLTKAQRIIATFEKSINKNRDRGLSSGFSHFPEDAQAPRRGRRATEGTKEFKRYSTWKKVRSFSAPKPKRKIGALDEFMESEHSSKIDMDTDSNKARARRRSGQLGDFLASEAASKKPQENCSNLAQVLSCASSQGSGKRQRKGSARHIIQRSKSASSMRSSRRVELPSSMWAITYEQLLEVDRKAVEVFGPRDYPKRTMRDIVKHIVVPVCLRTGKSFALSINKEGVPVDTFVSHSWDGSFHKFVNTIKKTFRASVRKPNLWICAFALLQGNNEKIIAEQLGSKEEALQEGPFVHAIQAASTFCIVRNSNTDVYSRAWCVCELMFAKFYGLYPSKTQVTGPDVFATNQTSVLDAQAFKGDRARILKVLLNKFDQEEIDKMVQQLRTHQSL